MRKIYIGLIASIAITLLVFSTMPVYSATIDQVFTSDWTNVPGGYSYQQYYLFDSSLGTLSGITITIDTSLSGISPSGNSVFVRYDFYSSDYWFYNQKFMYEGDYHRTWSNFNDTVAEWAPEPDTSFREKIYWIGSSGSQGTFYQEAGMYFRDNLESFTFNSTTHLIYDYTPAPVPRTLTPTAP